MLIEQAMHKGRLEAFSDAVIAIIMTVMVLDLHPPVATSFASLVPVLPTFCTYALSFVFLAIYWNNHHHMLQAAKHVNGAVLWANMHLLFWLSLTPFVTAWLGRSNLASAPVASYGVVLIGSAISYTLLTIALVRANGKESEMAKALGTDVKGKVSVVTYAAGIGSAFFLPPLSCSLYVLVAFVWLIPDRRFEPKKVLANE